MIRNLEATARAVKTENMIRIGIADDHPLVVAGVAAGISMADDMELVASVSTLADARVLLGRRDLDVVLLDVRLRDGNGLQALSERGATTVPAVIVVSTFGSRQYVAAAARFGAAAFVLKTLPLVELVDAVARVARGEVLLTTDQRTAPFVEFSERERAIVGLARQGLTNKAIGLRLGLSKKTVEAHLTNLFERYGLRGGRIELGIRAADEGWLEIDPPKNPTSRSLTTDVTRF